MCAVISIRCFRLGKLCACFFKTDDMKVMSQSCVNVSFESRVSRHINSPSPPEKTVIVTFEVPIVFLSIGGTSSLDEAYMEVSWYLQL
jgi:hypothetical protein